MKFISFIAFIFFLGAASVQLNDPDSYVWIIIYGSIALLTLATLFNQYFPLTTLISAFVYLLAVLWFSPNLINTSVEAFSSVQMKNQQHELVRETWGLLISFLWCAVLYLKINTADKSINK